MRYLLRRIIWILDGKAAEYGRPQRGQSVVELALFMPILILMLTGLAEMGWYTNNYLILLEVSRVAARLGTTLTGENDPISWERNNITYLGTDDMGNTGVSFRIDTRGNTLLDGRDYYAELDGDAEDRDLPLRDCSNTIGFYEAIVCLALDSLDPIELNPEREADNQDDIIVSVFSTNLIPDPGSFDLTDGENDVAEARIVNNINAIGDRRPFVNPEHPQEFRDQAPGSFADPDIPNDNAPQIMVTGRYPSMANECGDDKRDPFDLNGQEDTGPDAVGGMAPFELDERRLSVLEFEVPSGDPDNTLFDDSDGDGDFVDDEGVRGFSLTGRWLARSSATPCRGSEWNIYRMERLVNLRGLGLASEEMNQLPDQQSFVLVEIAWQHQLLLAVPGFSPMFTALGGENGSYIYVWAAFPVPSTEFFLNLNQ